MTLNGTLEINDVQQEFDELQSWEKKQFILQNIDHYGLFDIEDLINQFNIDLNKLLQYYSTRDICEFFNYYELLREIGKYNIIQYLLEQDAFSNSDIEDILEDKINNSSKSNLIKLETMLGEVIEKLHNKNTK